MKVYSYFVKARRRADGMYPVYIVVSRPQGRFMINSGLASSAIFVGNIFPRSERNAQAKTADLTNKMDAIEELALKNPRMSNAELKELVEKNVFSRAKSKKLVDLLTEYEEQCTNYNTRLSYKGCRSRIMAFDANADLDIDKGWLERFRQNLLSDISLNSAALYLQRLRFVFNRAIDEGLTENYPFRRFRIKQEPTRKRNLSADYIGKLIAMPKTKPQEKWLDLFMLSFYLIGVNPIDLLNATYENIVDGRFEYRRAKTGKLYSIKIEPEAWEIIDRWKGEDYLLSFRDSATHVSIEKRCNDVLKGLRNGLTLYYARHSWASIAAELDIPKETISEALGHSLGSSITSIYINFNQKKVDEANRKVIDYVLK